MIFTTKFRTQHDEILAMATEITNHLQRGAPDAAYLRKALSNLAGKVSFHLAMEDQSLYPLIMERKGTPAEAAAMKFQREMGGLAEVFGDYNTRWQLSAIRSDMAGFAAETRKVFGALANRIARENNELYPLADKLA